MRKPLFIFLLFIAIGCSHSDKYVIHGIIVGDVTEDWVYMERIMDENAIIDSVPIVNGEFTFKGRAGFPEVYGISYHPERAMGIALFFLEPGELNITIDDDDWYMGVSVEGGKVNDEYALLTKYRMDNFMNKIHSLNQELATVPEIKRDSLLDMIEQLMEEDMEHAITFVKDNPTSPLAIYHLLYYTHSLSESYLEEILDNFSNDIKNTVIFRSIKEELEIKQTLSEGILAYELGDSLVQLEVNFEGESIIEDLLNLNPNKGLFIDVWGTWCGVCLKEIPVIKELSREIKEEFAFLYLCVRSPKDEWENIITKNQLLGYHMLVGDDMIQRIREELNMEIRALPNYLVLDRQGKLLNQNSSNLKLDELVGLTRAN